MKKLHLITALLLIATATSATNYYVKASSGDYNGSKWTLANNNLQKMINQASAGDTIFVASGMYVGGFIMKEGVTVLGGYTANTQNPRERVLPNETTNDSQWSILDGKNGQRTLTQITDFETPTIWDGFVIRNGISAGENIIAGSLVYAPNGTEIIGIVYQYDEASETGKMISLAEAKKFWGGYQIAFPELPYLGKPSNDMSGEENTRIITEKFAELQTAMYPTGYNFAAAWCAALSIGGFSDWHLPSMGEWQEVYNAKAAIGNILIAAKAPLANGYWTSNHAGELPAWAFYFENGLQLPVLKYIEKNVRAIRSFQKSELTVSSGGEGSVLLKSNGILYNSIVDGNVTTIIEQEGDAGIRIFPNPVKRGETITVSASGILNISDISGKTIFSQKLTGTETQILVPDAAGVYVLRLGNGKTSKIIVY